LNKITMDNFDTLAGQLEHIFDTEISNTEQLTKLVTLIFEKTVQEHVYGPLYAKLCVTLSSKEKSFDEMVITQYGSEVKQVDFKNVLVKVCQAEFQKGKRPPQFTAEMDAQDRENEKIKVKKILLGTMKFIGQLYLSQLLPSKVMTLCLGHLISPQGGKPTEDDVEGACTLLTTVGPTLDNDERLNKTKLGKYYAKLGTFGRSSSYPPRIKILVQNLIDLRKKHWNDSRAQKVEGPKKLKEKKSKTSSAVYVDDYADDLLRPMIMNEYIDGHDDGMETISAAVVPVNASLIAQSNRTFGTRKRYGDGKSASGGQNKRGSAPRRTPRSQKGSRKLLETEENESTDFQEEKYNDFGGYEANIQSANSTESTAISIGMRKSRMALSASIARPCDDGKTPDEDKLYDIMGNYLNMKANVETTIAELVSYKIQNRVDFIRSNIQRAIDGDKGERLSQLIPKLLDEYILLSTELDDAFIAFFKGYTYEDNPQINKLTPKLLAPLLVDAELNFSDLLQWILLDTRENQPDDDMLEYYDGDGVRNLIRNSKTITKALDLLGYLFKELKEVAFEDSDYTKKLLIEHNFAIDRYMDQSDLANMQSVKEEWVDKYGLKFAF